MDYDRTSIPEAYDRGRTLPPDVMDMWMERIAAHLPIGRQNDIIDLGCGTGRFSGLLAKKFEANVVGIDPSQKMLAQAAEKTWPENVSFKPGTGEHMLCPDASADLVFSSMAFHHFESPANVAQECHRVLRSSGFVCIRNSTREYGSPYANYFPNYHATLEILPSADEIKAPFVQNRFLFRSHEAVAHTMALDLNELANKASHRADSTLIRLSDKDFETGLQRMRDEASRTSGPIMINIGLFVFKRIR